MKKVFLMAAAAATIFASCAENNNPEMDTDNTQVVIKISGVVSSATRTEDNPGKTDVNTIELNDGHVFVVGPTGAVIHKEALNPTLAKSTGQRLGAPVPTDSRVYIVGNIASDATASLPALETFADIQEAVSAISTQQGVDKYKSAALANKNGQPQEIELLTAAAGSDPAVYVANIVLTPLISRLELVAVEGGANTLGDRITAFKVTGVYLDDDYPQFTYGGSGAGTKHSQGTSVTFTGVGDVANATATLVDSHLVATPGASKVWGYNVAAGEITRLIVRLEDVKWLPAGGSPLDEEDLTGKPYFLTVTGYNNGGLTGFARGTIYRIGVTDDIAGGTRFIFTPDDLNLTPNPTNILLDVKVAIEEWKLANPSADLQ